MSKDFEQAYRELAESEIPDLWDRIEAGLESRSTPKQRERVELDVGTAEEGSAGVREKEPLRSLPDTDGQEHSGSGSSREKKKRRFFPFKSTRSAAGVAAAVLCVAVVLPAAYVLFRSGSWRMGSAAGATVTEGFDTAAAESAEESAAEENSAAMAEDEAAPAQAADASESGADAGGGAAGGTDARETQDGGLTENPTDREAAAGTAQAMNDSGQARKNETEDLSEEMTQEMEETLRETQDGPASESGNQSAASGYSDREKKESAVLEDASDDTSTGSDAQVQSDTLWDFLVEGSVYEHVVLLVSDAANDFEREDGSPPGTLYTATVQKDGSGQLGEGQQLTVDVPAYSSLSLVKDEAVEVDLIYNGNGRFGIEKFHRQVE